MLTLEVLLYPGLLMVLFILMVFLIPRSDLRYYLPYGIVLGGLMDVVLTWLFQDIFKVIKFTNLGMFHCSGQTVFSPLGWTLVITLYLYLWPKSGGLKYAYTVTWSVLAVAFGQLLANVGLFQYVPWFYPIPLFFVLLGQFVFAVWIFQRSKVN